jgi:hypothetical protein
MTSPTPSDTESLYLHLAPNGYRCGMVAVNHEGLGLHVLVLPKLWKGVGTTPRVQLDSTNRRLLIIGHEGQRIELKNTPSAWRALFDEAARGAFKAAEGEPAEGPPEDEPDNIKEQEVELRVLLSIMGSGRAAEKLAFPAESKDGDLPAHSAHYLAQLVRLVLLSGALRHRTLDYSPFERAVGYLVDEGEQREDTLKVLNAHAFVEEVKARAREVRQGYLRREEWLAGVRGRVTARGLVRYAATGEPVVECEYDDFTPEIDLFQVIVTALGQVERGAPFPPMLRELAAPIRQEAARLCRDLAHIPQLPRAVAAHKAGHIRLTRLWRPWAAALHMARLILQDRPLEFTGQHDGAGALVWSVDTSKVWEGILRQMLARPHRALVKQGDLVQPWNGVSDRPPQPDFRFTEPGRRWILDAKYKLREDVALQPTRDEKHQIFLYSHLPAEDERAAATPALCCLLYAHGPSVGTAGKDGPSASSDPILTGGLWQRAPLWPSPPDAPPVHLATFAVPFPQPEAWREAAQSEVGPSNSPLASNERWAEWIAEWSHHLGEALKRAAEKQDNESN